MSHRIDTTLNTECSFESLAQASQRGSHARACGAASHDNPHLEPDALPGATGRDRVSWFIHVTAWWRGWDDEDTTRTVREWADLPSPPLAQGAPPFRQH